MHSEVQTASNSQRAQQGKGNTSNYWRQRGPTENTDRGVHNTEIQTGRRRGRKAWTMEDKVGNMHLRRRSAKWR